MGLTLDDIDHAWVAGLCRDLAAAAGAGVPAAPDAVEVRAFALTELGDAQGVISRYERSTREAIVGHRVLTIRWALRGRELEDRIVLKSKAPGAVIRRRLEEVYGRIDPRLAALQRRLDPSILDDAHTRELQIYALDRPGLRAVTPAIHRVWLDPARQIYAIAMELLEGARHLRTLGDLSAWQPADIDCAVRGIARVHGEHLGELSAAAPPPWLVPFERLHDARLLDYQAALLAYNAAAFPELFGAERVRRLEALLASAPARRRAIASRPLTLIHGDLTPRNVCLRARGGAGELRLCAYDWELAQAHLPQRDICEFLCYVLEPRQGWRHAATAHLLERYRARLAAAAGRPIDAASFRRDLALALAEFCTFKLLVQGITHQLLGQRGYFERLVANAFDALAAYGADS